MDEFGKSKDLLEVAESKAALKLLELSKREKPCDSNSFYAGESYKPKVITVLHTCLPFLPGGYSSRAHGLISSMVAAGIDVIPITRPGFYSDVVDASTRGRDPDATEYDGIWYRHYGSPVERRDGEYQYMLRCIEKYETIFRELDPDLVHTRSTYLISLPAIIAAHKLGIPTIYEVSGLWELVYEGRGQVGLALRTKALEIATAEATDKLVTMNGKLARLISSRSAALSEDQITIIPNAVDLEKFSRRISHSNSKRSSCVFGYVGSLLDYEGLDTLIRAFGILVQRGFESELRIVGGGSELGRLQNLAEKLELNDLVTFTGQVAPEQARDEFEKIDAIVLPRNSTPATEYVTPLKPFEAMAMKKPLIVSDVGALKELASEDDVARIFESSNDRALAEQMSDLVSNDTRNKAMISRATNLVRNKYNWERVGNDMASVCRSMCLKPDRLRFLRAKSVKWINRTSFCS